MGPEGNNSRLTALWFNTIFPLSGATYVQTEYPLPDLSDLVLGQARVAQAFELVHLRLPLCSALQTAVYGPAHQGRFRGRAPAVDHRGRHHGVPEAGVSSAESR